MESLGKGAQKEEKTLHDQKGAERAILGLLPHRILQDLLRQRRSTFLGLLVVELLEECPQEEDHGPHSLCFLLPLFLPTSKPLLLTECTQEECQWVEQCQWKEQCGWEEQCQFEE